ncbi:MAG: hypothetical protein KF866_10495 [Phycisphaeraceae bacterium]|nr:hypothetical protein [Phycisphaeraceae bacterium]MCW5754929.1 hypothetical protein [Phycisphaeraceae bacterium]
MGIATRSGVLGVVLAVSFPALGDLPGVLDRVPANAGLTVTVSNLSVFHERVSGIARLLRLDQTEAGQSLRMAGLLLGTPGLDPQGSVALTILSGPDGSIDFDADDPPMAMLIPLRDFGAFVDTFNGVVDRQMASLEMMGEEVYLRDVGGGWGVLGPNRDLVASYDATPGKMASHRVRLGAVGGRVAAESTVVLTADIQVLAPMLSQAVDGFQSQMDMAAMMMGEQGAGLQSMAAMFESAVDELIRDGQVLMIGLGLGDQGISLDAAVQFRQGSESAGKLSGRGRAFELLGRVPNEPFLLAMSLDTSSPGMKAWLRQMSEMSAAMNPEQGEVFGFMDLNKFTDDQDATVFVIGNPPSVIGGTLFSRTVQYTECSNPRGMLDAVEKAVLAMNDQIAGPMTFKTDYTRNVIEIGGIKADAWSMSMRVDPADPEGQQVGPMLAMIFGAPLGPSGYYAPTRNGVVTTFTKNTAFLGEAIDAAQTGNGLNRNPVIARAAAHLPKDSAFQMYIGLREVHQHIGMFAALAGINLGEAPEQLGTVAAAASMSDGGVHARLYIPNALLDFGASLAQRFNSVEEAPPPRRGPRF